MEQNPKPRVAENQPEEQENLERPNFFRAWLARLNREDYHTSDTQEDHETTPEKSKKNKKRSVFSRLFKKHVDKEPVEDARERELSSDSMNWWPGLAKNDIPKEKPDAVSEQFEESVNSLLQPVAEVPVATADSNPKPELTEDKVPDMPLPQREHRPAEPEIAQIMTSPSFETGSSNDQPKVEVITDKREPLAAVGILGLGAEYIGRKRADRAQSKKIEKSERAIKSVQERVEAIAAQKVGRVESANPAAHPSPEVKPIIAPVPELSKSGKKEQVRPKEELAEKVAKRVETYEKARRTPEAIMKEVVRAAEVNAPVERALERRQEVRDEPSTQLAEGAVAVGTVLQQMTGSSTALPAGAPINYHDRAQIVEVSVSPEMYKQAAQRGFMGALVILTLALMVYLLS